MELADLMAREGIAPVGVVHVGAHLGQEIDDYRAIGFGRIVLVEPNPECHEALAAFEGVTLVPAACGRAPGETRLHLTVKRQRSSLYQPLRDRHRTVTVPVVRLADIQAGCNVAVVDVQGGELDVVAGADLAALDLVVLETRTVHEYRGAPLHRAVVQTMRGLGWRRAATWRHGTGRVRDVAFVREAV
ncbi:FkbM family methyltransferase [Streptomyces antibioticus]|uniref:FkbM family methyltransferase n=1 Tax=Streptomyces antibioticus TaxID=1890 RepID=UPI00367E9DC8